MQQCQYCFSQIDLKARKCKHCGEWVNSSNSFLSDANKTLSNGIKFIKKKRDDRQKAKWSHLHDPTNNNPLKVEGIIFYKDVYKFRGVTFPYSSITHITFFQSTFAVNSINSTTELNFSITHNNSQNTSDQFATNDLSYTSGLFYGKKKNREILVYAYKYISQYTVKGRIQNVIDEIRLNGFFKYDDEVKIYANGDITKKNKKDNIFHAFDNDLLVYGNFKLSGRMSAEDPYLFKIYRSKGPKLAFAGIDLSGGISFSVYANKDVFDALLKYALKNRTFAV